MPSLFGLLFFWALCCLAQTSPPYNNTLDGLSFVPSVCYRGELPVRSPDCESVIRSQILSPSRRRIWSQQVPWSYQRSGVCVLPYSWVNNGCIVSVKNKYPVIAQQSVFSLQQVADAASAILRTCSQIGYGGEQNIGSEHQSFFVEVYAPFSFSSQNLDIGEQSADVGLPVQ